MSRQSGGGFGPQVVGDKLKLHLPKLPGRLTATAIVLVVIVLVAVGLFRNCFTYVHPNEYGIKERKLGIDRGIQKDVYEAGYAFVLPFGIEKIHLFPRDVQVLELTAFPSGQRKQGMFERKPPTRYLEHAAKIQTSDGFYVDVDVTILYRINDPYKLITTVGPGTLYLHNGIIPKAEPILKQALGELTTEDFYNSPLRVAKTERARDLLSTELSPKGIEVDHVLVRYFKYSDEIQKNIEEKKLQDQLVFKNQAESKAAMEEAKLKRVTQEGEMNVKVTLEEGNAYKVKKDAERELYVRKKMAEADLLVKLAEAKATEMKNAAMQVLGSDKMVAMRMAEVLGGLDTIIVPTGGDGGLNALDLEQVLELFGAESATGGSGKTPEAIAELLKAPDEPPPPPVEPPPSLSQPAILAPEPADAPAPPPAPEPAEQSQAPEPAPPTAPQANPEEAVQ